MVYWKLALEPELFGMFSIDSWSLWPIKPKTRVLIPSTFHFVLCWIVLVPQPSFELTFFCVASSRRNTQVNLIVLQSTSKSSVAKSSVDKLNRASLSEIERRLFSKLIERQMLNQASTNIQKLIERRYAKSRVDELNWASIFFDPIDARFRGWL